MVDAVQGSVSLMTPNSDDLSAPDKEAEPQFLTGSRQMEQDNIVAIELYWWAVGRPMLKQCLKEQSFGYPTMVVMVNHHICRDEIKRKLGFLEFNEFLRAPVRMPAVITNGL